MFYEWGNKNKYQIKIRIVNNKWVETDIYIIQYSKQQIHKIISST